MDIDLTDLLSTILGNDIATIVIKMVCKIEEYYYLEHKKYRDRGWDRVSLGKQYICGCFVLYYSTYNDEYSKPAIFSCDKHEIEMRENEKEIKKLNEECDKHYREIRKIEEIISKHSYQINKIKFHYRENSLPRELLYANSRKRKRVQ